MFLLPFDKYTMTTSKSRESIVNKIRFNTADKKTHNYLKNDFHFFDGTIGYNTFSLSRIPSVGRSLCLSPVISGTISQNDKSSNVTIKMRASFGNLMIVLFWMLPTLLGAVNALYEWAYNDGFIENFILLFVLFILGYAYIMIGYKLLGKQIMKKMHSIIYD